jgi:hypothetical protein
MIDEMTEDRFVVKSDLVAGPFLILPRAQLAAVREVLDRNGIRYWADTFAISLDGRPATIVINFGRDGDATRTQAVLDEAG